MSRHDPRFTLHSITVQLVQPSYDRPKKRLSHTIKARPTGRSSGTFQGILARSRKGAR